MELITTINRPDTHLVDQLSKYPSATIHEAQGRLGALDSAIKPIDRDMSLCGPAFTVVCAPRDNIMLQVAISYAKPGDVIVVSAGEYTEAGSFGDVLANACMVRGIAGLVTDTGVRDTQEIRRLGLPVFSRSVSIKGTVKETLAPINEPITVGGQVIRPGDIIRGDADGVVVIRKEDIDFAIESSRAREDAEAGFIEQYKQGKTPIEVSNLGPILAAKGLTLNS
jgi:4-hydroxy-4-methyl-2-oxoglutarate aldolase